MFIYQILVMFLVPKALLCYHVQLKKIEGYCKEYPHTKAVANTDMSNKEGQIYLSVALNVTHQFGKMGKILFKLSKCPSLTEEESGCENLRNITIPKINFMVSDKNSEWSQVMKYDPPLKEPVIPGIYVAANRLINMDNWHIVVAKGSWKVRTVIFEDKTNNVIMCVYCEGVVS